MNELPKKCEDCTEYASEFCKHCLEEQRLAQKKKELDNAPR